MIELTIELVTNNSGYNLPGVVKYLGHLSKIYVSQVADSQTFKKHQKENQALKKNF